jgi:hypothetical protein
MEYNKCIFKFLENLINSRNKQDVAMELISEFIFAENRAKQRHAIDISLLEEFELVVILCEFFSKPGPDSTRNAVFLSLFGSITPTRISILVKLISTSMSCSVCSVKKKTQNDLLSRCRALKFIQLHFFFSFFVPPALGCNSSDAIPLQA